MSIETKLIIKEGKFQKISSKNIPENNQILEETFNIFYCIMKNVIYRNDYVNSNWWN